MKSFIAILSAIIFINLPAMAQEETNWRHYPSIDMLTDADRSIVATQKEKEQIFILCNKDNSFDVYINPYSDQPVWGSSGLNWVTFFYRIDGGEIKESREFEAAGPILAVMLTYRTKLEFIQSILDSSEIVIRVKDNWDEKTFKINLTGAREAISLLTCIDLKSPS